ncbi:polysaccharide pyruvyl transferase family protein, partial [Escherichia coli]
MAKFLLVGQADHDNFGDSLIYYCYLSLLKEMGHDADILNASEQFTGRINFLGLHVKNVDTKNIKTIEHNYNGVIFIPGGYLGCPDFTDVLWQKKWVKSDYFKSIFDTIDKLSIPIYIHGAEVGPFAKPIVFKYFKNVISSSNKVFVRNSGSASYIKTTMGIDTAVLPDFIFSLKHFVNIGKKEKLFKLGIHITGKVFANNFLSKRFMSSLIEVINERKIGSVLLFSDQIIPQRFKNAIDEFRQNVNANTRLEVRDYDDMASVISNASECDTIVTSKLHVGVTGLVFGAKVLCIASHPKLKRFYQDNNLSEAYLNYFLTSNYHKKEELKKMLDATFGDYQSTSLEDNIKNTLSIYKN